MDIIKVVNYIRQNASLDYKKAVDVIKTNNKIEDFNAMLNNYTFAKNEFATGLLNMIGASVLTKVGTFNNPVDKFKGTAPSTGVDIREIANGLITAKHFNFSTEGIAEMFKIHPSEFAECYHRLNRQDMYPITISQKELKLALTSWDNLENLVSEKMATLQESNKLDEYALFLDLVNDTATNENVKFIEVDPVTNDSTGLQFIETVKNVVSSFAFRDKSNCIYGNSTDDTKIKPLCNKEDCAIVMPYTLANKLDVNSIASAFNMDKLAYKTDCYTEVDTFGFIKRGSKYYQVDAIICDKHFFIIKDDEDNGTNSNDLPTVRAYNTYLHIWQYWSTSPFRCVNIIGHEVQSSDIPNGYFTETSGTTDKK